MKQFAKFAILLACLFCTTTAFCAKKIKYGNQGCNIFWSVYHPNESYQLVTQITTSNKELANPVTLKIKLFNDEIITLKGKIDHLGTESAGLCLYNLIIPISEQQYRVMYPISEEELDMLKHGVKKVQISTLPEINVKVFKKDVIGQRLWNEYQEKKNSEDDF